MPKKEDVKEDFCPSCLIVPLAVAGAASTAAGSQVSGKHKLMRKVLFYSGVITVASVLVILFYMFVLKKKEDCVQCRL